MFQLACTMLNPTIVKCVTTTDRQESAGKIMDINRAFVCVFNGNTRPDTLKYNIYE